MDIYLSAHREGQGELVAGGKVTGIDRQKIGAPYHTCGCQKSVRDRP